MLVCVGSVAYDVIEVPHREPVETLGGSATWFCTAASIFTKPYLIGVVGDDFREEDRAFLEHRGIEISGLERKPGTTFRWHGRYHDDLQGRESLLTELGVFAEFTPVVPERMRKPDFLFLGNISPELQALVMAQARNARFVALDTIECWIRPPHRERLLALLPRVDLVLLNDEEIRLLSGEANVVRAAKKVLKEYGPWAVAVKRGEHGAMLLLRSGGKRYQEPEDDSVRMHLFPAFPLEAVVDPTGAGDSFAGGLMGYLDSIGRVDAETLADAMAVGTIVASFSVEGFGPRYFDRVSRNLLLARLREYAKMVGFRSDVVTRELSVI